MSNTGGMETAPIDWLGWFDTMAKDQPRRNEYVGLTLADVVAQIGNGQPFRVIDINAVESGQYLRLNSDLRPNRVNLLARDGVVVAAAVF
jgi:hypothetical protein